MSFAIFGNYNVWRMIYHVVRIYETVMGKMGIRLALAATAILIPTPHALAEAWTKKAFRAESMFICAAYASVASIKPQDSQNDFGKQQKRLEASGYEIAKAAFIARTQAKKGKSDKDIIGEQPDILSGTWEGPNSSFAAGRLLEAAFSYAYRDIRNNHGKGYRWNRKSPGYTAHKFSEGNCEHLR